MEVGGGSEVGDGGGTFLRPFYPTASSDIVGGQCPAAKSAACLFSWCSTATETIRLVTGGLLHV